MTEDTSPVNDRPKFKKVRNKVKVRRNALTLDHIAGQIANNFVSAVYAAVGNKVITGMREGDYLEDVVDQGLEHDGMAEENFRLTKTKMEVHVGLDISGSMYMRYGGNPIVPAALSMRLMNKALSIVTQVLPSGVFTYQLWLWSTWNKCLTDQNYGTNTNRVIWPANGNVVSEKDIDEYLTGIARHEPSGFGGGTDLAPLIEQIKRWEEEHSDASAHRLNLIITDGALGDTEEASQVQSWRGGRLMSVIFNIGEYSHDVPVGFLGYSGKVTELQPFMEQMLADFVQALY